MTFDKANNSHRKSGLTRTLQKASDSLEKCSTGSTSWMGSSKPQLSSLSWEESCGSRSSASAVNFSYRGTALAPNRAAVVDGDLGSWQQPATRSIDHRALNNDGRQCNRHFLILLGSDDVLL